MDILIIKLGAIGDVIRTTSILHGLKEKYKQCRIDWVTKRKSLDILKHNNMINNVYLIDKNNSVFKNKGYDLIISLDDDYEACMLATKINSKNVIGAHLKNKKLTYTEGSSLWFNMGLISKFGKQKADALKAKNKKTYQEIMYKILGLKYKKQEPILILNSNELNFGKEFVQKNKIKKTDIIIGVNTGAGGRWQDKKLSIEKTVELIDKLNNEIKNIKLILFGGPEEKERNKKIKKLISQKSKIFGNLENSKNFQSKTNVIDAGCDNSLMEFASLVNLCNLLLTSDSLALHIGVALKKKIVCFFYPTSAAEIELYKRGIKIIGKGKSYCSYQTKCRDSPRWDIDEIANAVKKLIR